VFFLTIAFVIALARDLSMPPNFSAGSDL